ncbi:MAG TPA: ABC transporter permease [Vicinamibacterales bacterium]|nr:ABC transporter permease [Vicinamibacterales bacterium]
MIRVDGRIQQRLFAWLVPAAVVLAWESAVRAGMLPPSQSAAPSAIAVNLWQLLVSGDLFEHTMRSLARLVAGVALGSLAGVGSSLWLAGSRSADRLLSPSIQVLAGVPAIVWMPFWIMIWGTGEEFKVAMAAVTSFFLVHVYASHGIRSVGRQFVELAEMYEKTRLETIREVLLPAALPTILTAVRVTLGLGWIVIFFVEYASAQRGSEGLGWFISDARGVGRVEDEFAGLVFLAIMAFATDRALGFLQRRLVAWSDTLEMSIVHGIR